MSLFTRYAMDALMKTSHPEVNRRQCWNLHPHRTPCTLCKDICPYGDQIFTRPNLVKDWVVCESIRTSRYYSIRKDYSRGNQRIQCHRQLYSSGHVSSCR